ncbi:unnamed protein product, partial [Ectocarpus sp. 12 AP-2014]
VRAARGRGFGGGGCLDPQRLHPEGRIGGWDTAAGRRVGGVLRVRPTGLGGTRGCSKPSRPAPAPSASGPARVHEQGPAEQVPHSLV